MKQIVHKYLSGHFYVIDNSVFSNETKEKLSRFNLFRELDTIFSIHKRELMTHLRTWCKSQNRKFKFKEFWKTDFCTPIKVGYTYAPYLPIGVHNPVTYQRRFTYTHRSSAIK